MVLVEREVVHKMARTLSSLLERRQLPAWHDVTVTSQRKSTLEMLMSVTEEMGDVIAQMSLDLSRDEDDIEENTSHVMNTASHLANLASQLNEQEREEEPTIILTPNICKNFLTLILFKEIITSSFLANIDDGSPILSSPLPFCQPSDELKLKTSFCFAKYFFILAKQNSKNLKL
jgi:hypothetical protein